MSHVPKSPLPLNELQVPKSMSRSASESSVGSSGSAECADEDTRTDYEEKPAAVIEEELFKAVCEGNRALIKEILTRYRPSALLQVLLTFSYVNRSPQSDVIHAASRMNMASIQALHSTPAVSQQRGNNITGDKGSRVLSSIKNQNVSSNTNTSLSRPFFTFDADILQDAHELLGTSVSPLNLIQIACMLGDEELAIDILEFVYQQTVSKGQKLLLMEFLGKTWGDGNITLHLASFQGMSDLVKMMLKYGANTMKTNGRGYRPVDCADDDTTRKLFRSINDASKTKKEVPKKANSFSAAEPSLLTTTLKLSQISETMKLTTITSSTRLPSKSEPETPRELSVAPKALISSMKSTDSLPRITAAPQNATKRIYWEPNCLLHDYAKNGELDLIKALIKKVKENDDKSTSASRIYSSSIILDFNCKTPHTGFTPLHMACAYGHLDVAKFLIEEAKCDLQVRDSEGWTVLHSCIAEIPDPETFPNSVTDEDKKDRERFLEVLKYLLSLDGIDLLAMTDEGETVFEVVKEIDDAGTIDQEVCDLLEEAMTKRGIIVKRFVGADSETEESTISSPQSQKNYTVEHGSPVVHVKELKPRQSPSMGKSSVKQQPLSNNNVVKPPQTRIEAHKTIAAP